MLFILYRRLARARYYKRKDLARAQFAGSVKEFVDGSLRLEDAAVRFQQARSRPAKDAVRDLLLLTISERTNAEAVSELLFALGYVERWARIAFGRRRARRIIRASRLSQSAGRAIRLRRSALRPIRRRKLLSVQRAVAVYYLSRLAPARARVFLEQALVDPAQDVRLAAVLGLRGDPAGIPLLLEELRSSVEEHNDVSLRAIRSALVWCDMGSLQQFVPGLTHRNARFRFLVLDAVYQICRRVSKERPLTSSDFPAQVRHILQHEAAQDSSPDVRARCAAVIAYFHDANGIAALRQFMRDENEFVRLHAVRGSAHPAYQELFPEISARLTDPRWRVREAASQTLLTFGQPGVDSLLRLFVEVPDQYAAEQIAEEMQRSGVLNTLLAELNSGTSIATCRAVCARLVSLNKTSILADAVASSELAPAHRLWLMDALSTRPNRYFLEVLRGLAATQDEIGARALALVQRLAPALTASFEARHA
ncbi:MAG TPA: HEAT repeat domain-containing protein [Terriglobales bacterium]|nr:HEAT repeat domain-containing protein [Terriglobales bacterium]